jgi:hypothetical protein
MSIFVNVICALIGAIGAYLAVKKQRRDQREKEVKDKLISNVMNIDRLMLADIPAGGLSADLRALLFETDLRVEEYCRSRWYRPGANRRLREAWRDFRETITNAEIKKPIKFYGVSQCSKPEDFGLDVKIEALANALI